MIEVKITQLNPDLSVKTYGENIIYNQITENKTKDNVIYIFKNCINIKKQIYGYSGIIYLETTPFAIFIRKDNITTAYTSDVFEFIERIDNNETYTN